MLNLPLVVSLLLAMLSVIFSLVTDLCVEMLHVWSMNYTSCDVLFITVSDIHYTVLLVVDDIHYLLILCLYFIHWWEGGDSCITPTCINLENMVETP